MGERSTQISHPVKAESTDQLLMVIISFCRCSLSFFSAATANARMAAIGVTNETQETKKLTVRLYKSMRPNPIVPKMTAANLLRNKEMNSETNCTLPNTPVKRMICR